MGGWWRLGEAIAYSYRRWRLGGWEVVWLGDWVRLLVQERMAAAAVMLLPSFLPSLDHCLSPPLASSTLSCLPYPPPAPYQSGTLPYPLLCTPSPTPSPSGTPPQWQHSAGGRAT